MPFQKEVGTLYLYCMPFSLFFFKKIDFDSFLKKNWSLFNGFPVQQPPIRVCHTIPKI